MPLSKIAHYSIRTLDLEATRKFYTEVMGLTVGPRPTFNFPGLWLYNGSHDSYDNAVVHIIGIDPNDPQGLKDYLGDRDPDSLKGGTGHVRPRRVRGDGCRGDGVASEEKSRAVPRAHRARSQPAPGVPRRSERRGDRTELPGGRKAAALGMRLRLHVAVRGDGFG